MSLKGTPASRRGCDARPPLSCMEVSTYGIAAVLPGMQKRGRSRPRAGARLVLVRNSRPAARRQRYCLAAGARPQRASEVRAPPMVARTSERKSAPLVHERTAAVFDLHPRRPGMDSAHGGRPSDPTLSAPRWTMASPSWAAIGQGPGARCARGVPRCGESRRRCARSGGRGRSGVARLPDGPVGVAAPRVGLAQPAAARAQRRCRPPRAGAGRRSPLPAATMLG